jgi:2,3-bisphosphoglycerate-independent phosphoglycerate mutase
MDRDKRWERVAKAYQLLVNGQGQTAKSASAALEASYLNDLTDEFVLPHLIDPDGLIDVRTLKSGAYILKFVSPNQQQYIRLVTIND